MSIIQKVQAIRSTKKEQQTNEEKLQLWQQTRSIHGLSGEFAVCAALRQKVVHEEQIRMISELFGR